MRLKHAFTHYNKYAKTSQLNATVLGLFFSFSLGDILNTFLCALENEHHPRLVPKYVNVWANVCLRGRRVEMKQISPAIKTLKRQQGLGSVNTNDRLRSVLAHTAGFC